MRALLASGTPSALLLFLAFPVLGADTKKESAPAKPAAEKAPKDSYTPAGSLHGVVRSADGSRLVLSVTVRAAQATGQQVKVATVTKDVELEMADSVKIRSTHPLQQFDDKGNIKKRFTPKELKELKGDERLPGYSAELTDLHPGQTVSVKLARVRPAKPTDAPPAAKTGGGAKGHVAPRVVVTQIMISADSMK
jgi:hypothetical protein